MDRASEFIQVYNSLAKRLATLVGADQYTPFSQLVAMAAKRDAAVVRYASRLRDYGDLRNAIVHHGEYPEKIIAEPSSETLAAFKVIVESILSPKRLIPTFQRQVTVYTPHEPLIKALIDMRKGDFSQVVLMDDTHLSLLTTEGIARWLEKKATDDVISIQEATIADVHTCDPEGAFLIMAREQTIDDVRTVFTHPLERNQPRVFAIVVTQNGLDTERPLGIVTPWDLLGNG